MKRIALTVIAAAIAIVSSSAIGAGELGYVEDFSLAKDREAVLKQLIPGTDQYYYYHCLHFQNTGQDEKLADMLSQWIKRRKPRASTSLVREIEHRRALLNYRKDPQATLKYLKEHLGLHFHHQREVLGRKTSLPTRLNPRLISPDVLTREALRRHPGTVNGFEDSALQWLIARDIGADRRRHLLRRLTRPDLPKLPELIVADLRHKHSRGFGSMTIHRALLVRQLEQCLRLKGDLLNETNFVNIYLSKLRPNPDEDWRNDPKVRDAYLKRLWAFVSRLAPVHNSLKAHVLHQRLVFDRSRGVYNKRLFMEYIKLPRRVVYINPKYMQRLESRRYPANLNTNFTPRTMLPIIRRDEPVVRSYLMHFFVGENSYKPYELYIRDTYLKELFAETKIVNGRGDMEQWYSMLPPEKVKRLKERVDIDFAHTNRKLFAADERVGLDLYVKNVKTLFVKVYQINAFNYYRDKLREVNTDINLDGLVANEEEVKTYKDVPLRRVKRHFDFASLDKRGVYVIDFIGNGKSSRALIRKGKLRFIERTSTAGHVFTVMDETNRKLSKSKPAIWLAGHKYAADADGEITVPFSNSPGRQPIILTDGDFASLDRFDHQAERYTLQAGIHTDREALLAGNKTAQVIVRAALFLNNTPVTLSVLTDVSLVITSTDSDGVGTTKEVKDFKLFEGRESAYEFRTPQRLSRIGFTLKAKVKNLSKDKKQDLAASASFSLNAIDKTKFVEDLHLARMGGKYVLEVLGKSGEAKIDRPIYVQVKHRDFRNAVHASLQTDKGGRVMLGELKDIAWVRAKGPAGTQHTWHMVRDMHSYPSNIHGLAGETIHLPYMGKRKEARSEELSLLEVRGGTFVADRFKALRIKDGFIEVRGLPRGDYNLLIKPSNTRISIRLADGKERQGYVLGANRHLARIVEICKRCNLEPMIWSDMYFRMGSRTGDYYDEQCRIPEDVKQHIPRDVRLVYWDYYHDDEQFYLDWIQRHRDLGCDPVVASGVWTWGGSFWYDRRTTEQNAAPCIRACRTAGVRELFFTMWGDGGGYCEWDSALAGLAYVAEVAYAGDDAGQDEQERLGQRFSAICGADYQAVIEVSGMRLCGAEAFLWDDPLLGIYWKDKQLRDPKYWEQAARDYRDSLRRLSDRAQQTEPVDFAHAANLLNCLLAKIEFRLELERTYSRRDPAGLEQVRQRIPQVIEAIDKTLGSFRRQWYRRNKPNGFEVIQIRLGGLKQRYMEVSERLGELATGKIEKIPELDECPSHPINLKTMWRNLASASAIL